MHCLPVLLDHLHVVEVPQQSVVASFGNLTWLFGVNADHVEVFD